MENRRYENQYGMATGQRTIKHLRLSRAFDIFRHYATGTLHTSLPQSGNEIHTHQIQQLNVELWQQKMTENLRHEACR